MDSGDDRSSTAGMGPYSTLIPGPASALIDKPAALTRIKDPHRTIEVACFLRLTLLRLMDGSLTLLDHQISAQWRGARERAEETQAARLRRFRRLLGDLAGLAGDESLGAAELRARLKSLIAPFEPERQGTQVAAIRQELGRKSQDLARLLKLAREAPLAIPTDHKLAAAFATLDALAASPNALPASTPQPFGPSWQALIDQPDRAAALGCFRAATLMALKRALRNRSVSVDHSLSYRAPEDKLIPQKLWQRDRGRFIRDLNLPASSEKYLQRLEAGLSAGLAALAEAVEAGAVAIDGDELRLAPPQAGPEGPSRRTGATSARARPRRRSVSGSSDRNRWLDAVLLDPAWPPGPVGAGIGDALCRPHGPRLRSFRRRTGRAWCPRWRPTASGR